MELLLYHALIFGVVYFIGCKLIFPQELGFMFRGLLLGWLMALVLPPLAVLGLAALKVPFCRPFWTHPLFLGSGGLGVLWWGLYVKRRHQRVLLFLLRVSVASLPLVGIYLWLIEALSCHDLRPML